MPMRCFAAIDRPGAAFDGMLRIPAGTFRIGLDKPYPEEASVPRVTVDEFLIDRMPVTNRQFKAFVRAAGQPPGGGEYEAFDRVVSAAHNRVHGRKHRRGQCRGVLPIRFLSSRVRR
jgi:formylglycine-generating enzyme required for sulfatase activity